MTELPGPLEDKKYFVIMYTEYELRKDLKSVLFFYMIHFYEISQADHTVFNRILRKYFPIQH